MSTHEFGTLYNLTYYLGYCTPHNNIYSEETIITYLIEGVQNMLTQWSFIIIILQGSLFLQGYIMFFAKVRKKEKMYSE